MPTSTRSHYEVRFGDPPDVLTMPDDLSMAQEYLLSTLRDLRSFIPGWRYQALVMQVEHMPRAGFSFLVEGFGVVSVQRRK